MDDGKLPAEVEAAIDAYAAAQRGPAKLRPALGTRAALVSAIQAMRREDREALAAALRAFPVHQVGQLRHAYANMVAGHPDPDLLGHAIAALERWHDQAGANHWDPGDGCTCSLEHRIGFPGWHERSCRVHDSETCPAPGCVRWRRNHSAPEPEKGEGT
jgi:hypothetical protein